MTQNNTVSAEEDFNEIKFVCGGYFKDRQGELKRVNEACDWLLKEVNSDDCRIQTIDELSNQIRAFLDVKSYSNIFTVEFCNYITCHAYCFIDHTWKNKVKLYFEMLNMDVFVDYKMVEFIERNKLCSNLIHYIKTADNLFLLFCKIQKSIKKCFRKEIINLPKAPENIEVLNDFTANEIEIIVDECIRLQAETVLAYSAEIAR